MPHPVKPGLEKEVPDKCRCKRWALQNTGLEETKKAEPGESTPDSARLVFSSAALRLFPLAWAV